MHHRRRCPAGKTDSRANGAQHAREVDPEEQERIELAGLAFLARRWGTSAEQLRRTLTYDQFVSYLQAEADARNGELMSHAVGTAVAIAHVFNPKKKPLKKYGDALRRKSANPATAGDSPNMKELRRRVRAAMAAEKGRRPA